MTWSFDPRKLLLDGEANHAEEVLWNSKRAFRPYRSRFASTETHKERCAREAAAAKLCRKCIDCGLLLHGPQALRCATCAARRLKEKNAARQRKRINTAFVGHNKGFPAKPPD